MTKTLKVQQTLDFPECVKEGEYEGKWYVGVEDSWAYYLHTDGQVKFSAIDFDNNTTGYFETLEDATTARTQYYAKLCQN